MNRKCLISFSKELYLNDNIPEVFNYLAARVLVIDFDPVRDTFDMVIMSPLLDLVPEGTQLPVKFIEIERNRAGELITARFV